MLSDSFIVLTVDGNAEEQFFFVRLPAPMGVVIADRAGYEIGGLTDGEIVQRDGALLGGVTQGTVGISKPPLPAKDEYSGSSGHIDQFKRLSVREDKLALRD